MRSITASWMKAIEHMHQTCTTKYNIHSEAFVSHLHAHKQAPKHHKKHKDRCTDNIKPTHSIKTNGIQRENALSTWYDSLIRRMITKNANLQLASGQAAYSSRKKQNKTRTQYPFNTAENQKKKTTKMLNSGWHHTIKHTRWYMVTSVSEDGSLGGS